MVTSDVAARFARSATERDTAVLSTAEFHRWWARRCEVDQFQVTPIPFAELDGWHFEAASGNLAHDSGRFFTIEGLRCQGDAGREWTQPIINQPEIGILGIVAKEFDGVLHFLMQAKMEPGNVNRLQLSPTVQATRSNYMRVHQGSRTRFLEYFLEAKRGHVLVDVLQSEQGVYFWRKRNRNMVVEVTEDVPEHEDFCWLTLHQLLDLLKVDNLVNMDARTVMACMALSFPPDRPPAPTPFQEALLRSYDPAYGGVHTPTEIISWFNERKAVSDWRAHRIPLRDVAQWARTADEIADADLSRFRIMAVRVGAGNREVTRWSQPLLAPCHDGLAAFFTRNIGGVLHLLVQSRSEPGLLDIIEMGPTVKLPAVQDGGADREGHSVPFAAELAAMEPERIRFSALLSEEGGRFYHAQTRYQIIELDESFPLDVPPAYCWLTVHQLMDLVRHGHYLNVEARSLLACLHAVS
ncbi:MULTISPECIES: NDP-hexose 2,3-dehydratase family protein [Dactylosporangium]|uniref:NDP-hexose 2,3-dehydratase n=2 Tax=Dactylosporangium TaxID=35753 RepID=A0A9W6NMY2_9ACTN|nr:MULTISPECIES: NDP-hexose 2,3-dehydratase family protein [Dactylosporangium]UAB97665.1 NDP-hexose 2,3-dehydratase family protein [Dactylosporangium vinaceum]UWZ45910.1 NDP-hexose 2,3-dehydratase family protein [Dactylosporangium matsuzakiense]GLL02924.1 NDP-hexose 2,3-dehydratase [Dactylosporangium matsuzakiense]